MVRCLKLPKTIHKSKEDSGMERSMKWQKIEKRKRSSSTLKNVPSNDGINHFKRIGEMPQREIIKYLDLHSLVAFSQVCTEWRDLAKRCNCWEEASRSSNIPRCWYFEHADLDLSTQWTAHCSNPTHTWERAIRREKVVEYKWRSRDIEVKEIANVHCIPVDSLFTYGEWVLMKLGDNHLYIMDLLRLSSLEDIRRVPGPIITKLAIMRFSNKPHLLIMGTEIGAVVVYEFSCRTFNCLHILIGHKSPIASLGLSRNSFNQHRLDDSGLFVSGSLDGSIRLWNALTGECLRIFDDFTSNLSGWSWQQRRRIDAITFYKDCIVSADWWRRTISMLTNDSSGNDTRYVLKKDLSAIRVELNEKWLVSINHTAIHIVDLEDESYHRKLEKSFTNDGDEVIVDFKSNQIIYYNMDSIYMHNIGANESVCFQKGFLDRMARVLAIQANENFVYSVHENGKIYLWDRKKCQLIHELYRLPVVDIFKCHLALSESSQRLFCVVFYFESQGVCTGLYTLSVSQLVIEES
nr:f box:WD repeat containing protein 7 [Hymenolepis microstoma]